MQEIKDHLDKLDSRVIPDVKEVFRTGSHAGQFLEKKHPNVDHFLPGSPSLYLFSKRLNWLEFDPTYPKNPSTLGEYIRKWRMDKGIFIKDLAKELGVTVGTVINWEKRGTVPTGKSLVRKPSDAVPEAGRFF